MAEQWESTGRLTPATKGGRWSKGTSGGHSAGHYLGNSRVWGFSFFVTFKMTNIELRLLALILAECNRVKNLSPVRSAGDDVDEWVRRSFAIQDLASGMGVRVSGEWLGRDASARQARKRGLMSLERQGLIDLHASWGANVTHVALTEAGIGLADELTRMSCEAAPIGNSA